MYEIYVEIHKKYKKKSNILYNVSLKWKISIDICGKEDIIKLSREETLYFLFRYMERVPHIGKEAFYF